jgi:PilZ domain
VLLYLDTEGKDDQMQKDKRSFEREKVILKVEHKGLLTGKKYRLRDISKSGFSLETDQCMAEGDLFDFSFTLPDSKDIIRLCGKVIWIEKTSSIPENYYIGLAFLTELDKLPALFSLPLNEQEKEEFTRIYLSDSPKN